MRKIVILGAGYAGLEVARSLGRVLGRTGSAHILLVNDKEYHVFTTELHKVAAGTAEPADVTASLADLLDETGVELIVDRVEGIDPERRAVELAGGTVLAYDRLVVALGSTTEYWGIPGLRERSLSLNGLEGATAIRERVREVVQRAEEAGRQAHIVIGGGGLTGVELAGELAFRLAKGHRITVVELAPNLLVGQPERLSREAERILAQMGVTIRTGVGLNAVDEDTVLLSSGERMDYDVLLWAGGVRGNPIVAKAFPADTRDRAIVDSWMRSEAYPDVYIVGDAAAAKDADGKPVAPTAQAALAQAEVVVKHILYAGVQEEHAVAPYSGRSKGVLVSIGPKQGLGKIGAFGGSGRVWKLLKDANDIRYHLRIGARNGRTRRRETHARPNTESGRHDRAHTA